MYHNLRNASQLKPLLAIGVKSVTQETPSLSALVVTQTRCSSGHNPFPGDQFTIKNTYGWKSWRDIPDSMIPTTSKRDPNNLIYQHRRYINLRKKQIWVSIDDGLPIWLKFPGDKYWYYGLIIATFVNSAVLFYNMYLLFTGQLKKKVGFKIEE